MESSRIDGVERIAVLRAGGLGDAILVLPALDALRAAYSRAEVTLLGGPWHELFGAGRAPVDATEALPVVPAVHDWPPSLVVDHSAIDGFVDRMRARRFDLAVQLHHGSDGANRFLLRLGARTTVGLRQPGATGLDRDVASVLFHHDVLRALEAVAACGAPPVGIAPRLIPTASDRAIARAALGDGHHRAPIVLHPGGSDPRKRWPAACFARLADALAEQGHRCVVVGTEADVVGAVVAGSSAAEVASPLDLGALAAALARAPLVVGNDSGVRHLAEAVGAPTVGIYFATNALNTAPLGRARHRVLLSWQTSCARCGTSIIGDGCAHRGSWITDVGVDEVLDACTQLLASTPA